MGRRSGTLRTDSVTNHSVWNHPCKNQSVGSISGSYLDTLCRNRIRSFQHESGRTPAPLSKRIRSDSVCLLNWFAGRTRLFFSIQKGWLYPEYAGHAGSSIRSNHYCYPALHHRNSDYHNGRYSVGSRHQYSGAGSRTTGQ